MPRPYPPEFRRRALDLVESGRTVGDVAASLGIAESCLYRWRHRDLVDRGLRPGPSTAESAELAAARNRIRDLEEELKILRKAAAAVEAVVRPNERYRLVAELHTEGAPCPALTKMARATLPSPSRGPLSTGGPWRTFTTWPRGVLRPSSASARWPVSMGSGRTRAGHGGLTRSRVA
jgi:transposase-like protein